GDLDDVTGCDPPIFAVWSAAARSGSALGNQLLTITCPGLSRFGEPQEGAMNVITVASRKGGAGKTTLTAHLAAYAAHLGRRCLVIDADPQGSLALRNSLRRGMALPLVTAERGIERPLALAAVENYDYVFIDTSPTMWVVVQEAIRAATLVVI